MIRTGIFPQWSLAAEQAMNISRNVSVFLNLILAVLLIPSFAPTARAGLTHRYSFTDNAAVKDSVGNIDGKLQAGASVAGGKLLLKNENKNSGDNGVQYVEFDQPLIPSKGSVSLVFWFTASNTDAFARILDIGDQQDGDGHAFIYFTPRDADDQSRGAITASDAASKTAVDNDRLDDSKEHMVAIVVDAGDKKLHLYIDGKEPKPAEDLGQNDLESVRPKHTWLGRSGFDNDPGLTASIEELRVYDNPLSADDVAAAFSAGPQNLPARATQPSPTK
jgi:hypothetical protein